MPTFTFREFGPERAEEFAARGHRPRHFFPHRLAHLPKCGPDGLEIATSMCGETDPGRLWELVLYAAEPVVERFPRELFFDDELSWHRQQFGRPGQVATANLVLGDGVLHSAVHVSDLVQRIARRPEHRTRVDKLFNGWPRMLLNGVMSFALERGVRKVRIATAQLALENTDPARDVGPALFERVYDQAVEGLLPARRKGGWWEVDVAAARERIVVPERRSEPLPAGPTVCVCHDVERGLGHGPGDPDLGFDVEAAARHGLDRMLAVEAEAGCAATYHVVGLLFDELRPRIEEGGHALAFHSFDHPVPNARHRLLDRLHARFDRRRTRASVDLRDSPQLWKCRSVDYRAKGYRPPQSRIGTDLTDAKLCFYNFEWLASNVRSLGFEEPRLENGLVKVPVLADDFELYRSRMPYREWEEWVVETLTGRDFASLCLHDCYAPFWSDGYPRLLERVQRLGRVVTVDALAAEVTLANAA
jgi:hypothetical protein